MSSNPNRNKVLLGFSAVVAVLIVAILLWPANFRKEDASGAIGAVQKHRAPQITQQDVILGGESVKHQQQVLYKDFFADAGKLRALAANGDVAAIRAYQAELEMRGLRAAEETVEAASRVKEAKVESNVVELRSMIANQTRLSAEDLQAFNDKLGMIAILIGDQQNAMSRIKQATTELSQISLADEQIAMRKLGEVDQAMNRIDAEFAFADNRQYVGVVVMESQLASEEIAHRSANRFELMATELDSRAHANIAQAALRDEEVGTRMQQMLADVDAVANRNLSNRAGMVSSSAALNLRLNALAGRLSNQVAACRQVALNLRQVEARNDN